MKRLQNAIKKFNDTFENSVDVKGIVNPDSLASICTYRNQQEHHFTDMDTCIKHIKSTYSTWKWLNGSFKPIKSQQK